MEERARISIKLQKEQEELVKKRVEEEMLVRRIEEEKALYQYKLLEAEKMAKTDKIKAEFSAQENLPELLKFLIDHGGNVNHYLINEN